MKRAHRASGGTNAAAAKQAKKLRKLARRTAAPAADAHPAAAAAERERMDREVAFLNARARTIAQEILTIGQYLLREFFDDDPHAVAERNRDKINSFRDLAAREDLLLSHSTLWRAVNVAIQERRLGGLPALGRLTTSHKIEILGVADLPAKRKLATAAAEEGWSVRRLKEEIRRREKAAPRERGSEPDATTSG